MPTAPFALIENADYGGAVLWVFTDYVGFGMIWMLLGIMIFSLVYSKTQSIGISGVVFIAFIAAIGAVLPPETQKYFSLIIGVMLAIILLKLWLGDSG